MFGIKAKLLAIFGAINVVLLAVVTFFARRASALKDANEQLEADIDFKENVAVRDSELDSDYSDKRREAKEELDDGEIPEHLRNPRA